MAELCKIKSERSVIIEMLQTYKNFPCLWDVSHKLYKNKDARQQALEVLLEIWKKVDDKATAEGVKRKIENMRAAFSREWRKVENSRLAENRSERIHRPLLWYYEYLTFLKGSPMSKRTGSDSYSDDEDAFENEDNIKNKRRMTESQNIPEKVQEVAYTLHPDEDKTSDSFARTIGLQLKEMTKLQRCIAEKLISEVMFYGKLDKLTMQSTIININNNTKIYDSALSLSSSNLNCPYNSRQSFTHKRPSSSPESNASSSSGYCLLPPMSPSSSHRKKSPMSVQESTKLSKPLLDPLENYDTTVKSQSDYNTNFSNTIIPGCMTHNCVLSTDSSELISSPLQKSVVDQDIFSSEFSQKSNCEGDGSLLKGLLIIKTESD